MGNTSWKWAAVTAAVLISRTDVVALDAPAPAGQGPTADQAFLSRALGTNELELRLGHLAVSRASTPEVKALGEKMIKKHTDFGRELGDLAKRSGMSVRPEMSSEEHETYSSVESRTGAQFDETFKQTVDARHVQELAMYRDEAVRAENPELRALAQRRVSELQKSMAPAMGTGAGGY